MARARSLSDDDMGARAPDRETDPIFDDWLEFERSAISTQDNRFGLDFSRIPRGMVMEWKRVRLVGKEDPRNQVLCQQQGWHKVPHHMQPHILGHLAEGKDQSIVIDGLQLMMRPERYCREYDEEIQGRTGYHLAQHLQALRLSSKEQVGAQATIIKRTYGAAPTSATQAID